MINGPENTLVAVVEVDETAFDDVDAASCPITLITPAVVEVIAGHTFAVTFPVTFTCPIDEFPITWEAIPPAALLAIIFPVIFTIPVNTFEIVVTVPAPLALPPITFPVTLITPFCEFVIVVFPLPAAGGLIVPITLIIPLVEFNTLVSGAEPPAPFLPKTLPTILIVPEFKLSKHLSIFPLPEFSWDVIVILPVP